MDQACKGWVGRQGLLPCCTAHAGPTRAACMMSEACSLVAPQPRRACTQSLTQTRCPAFVCSIPGFYSTFQNKLRNLQQGCDTTVWLCLEVGCCCCLAAACGAWAPSPLN